MKEATYLSPTCHSLPFVAKHMAISGPETNGTGPLRWLESVPVRDLCKGSNAMFGVDRCCLEEGRRESVIILVGWGWAEPRIWSVIEAHQHLPEKKGLKGCRTMWVSQNMWQFIYREDKWSDLKTISAPPGAGTCYSTACPKCMEYTFVAQIDATLQLLGTGTSMM